MAGASSTCAPSSRRRAENEAACSRARVTTMVRPARGRRPNQSRRDRRPTASPTISSAGGTMRARRARSTIRRNGASTTCWSARVAQRTSADGVSG
jgi:hypothetical protein